MKREIRKSPHRAPPKSAPPKSVRAAARPTAKNSAGLPVLLRCAPGLSRMMQHEMRFRKLMERGARPTEVYQRNHDIVFLKNVMNRENIAQMRIAEDAGNCLIHGQFKITPAQLDRAADALLGLRHPLKLAVTADGRHFDRRDMERFMSRELIRRGVRLADEGKMLWLFIVDEKFYLVQETAREDAAWSRHLRRREREGSLPPTIGAAMAFIAKPQPRETVLDPCCGSGTLLAEAHGLQPDLAKLTGFDLDAQAIAIARENLRKIPNAEAFTGDGTQTARPDASVDLLLANLPFGKQYGKRVENPALYAALLKEALRLAIKPAFRAVLLTSDVPAFKGAMQEVRELKYEEAFNVKIRGEQSRCYLVTLK
ncbi:MAG TPA: methyltransferase domain-containing protein [Patescibacteria group bacterium]|nr:methyltransferase domain-containing protein [Patescibacteria group bacterium]